MTSTTPLHDLHTSLGATFIEFAGWRMPVRYAGELLEHQAVRTSAGIFDLSHMAELEVTGPGAAAALDHALVSHLSTVAVGRAKYTLLCTEAGGVIDDLVVYRLREDHFLVVANAANADVVSHELQARTAGFDATVDDTSAWWALIAVQGPSSAAILSALTSTDVESLRYYGIDSLAVAGVEALVARTGYTGEDGFELFVEAANAEPVWNALTAAGAELGLRPAGLAARDLLRLEAGMPLYGQELTRDTTPYAAGLGRIVALGKPHPFVGRDALAAADAQGSPRRLVGLALSGRRSPRTGYDVVDLTTTNPIGTVTSGAPSPTLGQPIAMAYIDTEQAALGSTVHVNVRGTLEPAIVVSLPFYRRARPTTTTAPKS